MSRGVLPKYGSSTELIFRLTQRKIIIEVDHLSFAYDELGYLLWWEGAGM